MALISVVDADDPDVDFPETNIAMVKGDSENLQFTITDDADPPAGIDLSKASDATADFPAIVRFAVKESPADETNEDAMAFKTSYDSAEILIDTQTGAGVGRCTVLLDGPDTDDERSGVYSWDLEMTQQDISRTDTGTVTLTDGGTTVIGVGTSFTDAKVGDVFQPDSLLLNALKASLIKEIVSDTEMVVERTDYAAEAGLDFSIRRGLRKTVARGTFTLAQDVVSTPE